MKTVLLGLLLTGLAGGVWAQGVPHKSLQTNECGGGGAEAEFTGAPLAVVLSMMFTNHPAQYIADPTIEMDMLKQTNLFQVMIDVHSGDFCGQIDRLAESAKCRVIWTGRYFLALPNDNSKRIGTIPFLTRLLRVSVGLEDMSPEMRYAADFNHDMTITPADVTLGLQLALLP